MTVVEYNACVDQYADGVYRFILKNLKDEDQAKDIVQEAFEKLWLRVGDIAAEKGKSWLFTTAYRTMVDQIRRAKFATPMEEEHEDMQVTYNHYNDLKEILHEALAKLNDIQRSVLMLRDYEGYSYEEIGEITGLNESQVKVYIYRCQNCPETIYRQPG